MAKCKYTHKITYGTWDKCMEMIKILKHKPGRTQYPERPYLCEHCAGWHMTSQPMRHNTAPPRLIHEQEFKKYLK